MRKRLSKISRISLGATLLLVAVAGVGQLIDPPEQNQALAGRDAFDLQGHRGARGLLPENTLPAFEGAMALGVTTLEMDVGLTRDGVLVVQHDRRLNPERTRGPEGAWLEPPGPALAELDLAQLQRYDVGRAKPGSKVAQRFPDQAGLDGIAIPTLEAVLVRTEVLSGGTIRYNIETKISPLAPGETAAPDAFVAALVELIGRLAITERVTIQSFDWRSLQLVQARAPGIATAYLTAQQNWLDNVERGQPGASPWTADFDIDDHQGSLPRTIAAAGGAIWSPHHRDLEDGDLKTAQGLGLKVIPWTVNEPAEMAALIARGVDGLITDYPDRLRQVMAEKGLSLPPAFADGQ